MQVGVNDVEFKYPFEQVTEDDGIVEGKMITMDDPAVMDDKVTNDIVNNAWELIIVVFDVR